MQVPKLRHEQTTRSPRTYANTSVSGLFNLECPPVLAFGALRVVTCQLPRVSPPWELERDARGLTFDFLTSCVVWTELVEGIPVSKLPAVRLDLRRLTCLIRPSARDHSALARLRGHKKQPKVQTNQGKRPTGLARFWGLLPGASLPPGFTPR